MKPSILVFTNHVYAATYYNHLHNKYTFIFRRINYKTSPQQHALDQIKELNRKKIRIDAVIGMADDTALVASIVASILKLPHLNQTALYKTQHKTIFLDVAKTITKTTPNTAYLSSYPTSIPPFSYPAFIRPVRDSLSSNAYSIQSQEHLIKLLPRLLKKKKQYLHWFEQWSSTLPSVPRPPIHAYLIQPFMNAKQYTVDGFVWEKKVVIMGYTESIYTPDRKSFKRFDFPATLPTIVKGEVEKFLRTYTRRVGYNNAGFNMEFFVDNGHMVPIEMNTRISIQFALLFREWYTTSTIETIVELALGKKPSVQINGRKRRASSCVLRTSTDCLVVSTPTPDELQALQAIPNVVGLRILVENGKKLSDYQQDSYTYRYALIDIAGKNKAEILKTLEIVKKKLTIKLVPLKVPKGPKGPNEPKD